MTISSRTLNAKISEAIVILAIALAAAAALQGAEWRQEVIDPSGGGKFSSLRIDTFGNAHVAYVDDGQLLLKYSFWDHNLRKWFTTAIDQTRGFCSLTLDSKQRPHISYLAYGDGQLKYAFWNGTSWQKQVIRINARDISYYTSIVLDAHENPTITYYEYWGTGEDYRLNLRDVSWNGSFWAVRTIDSVPGSGKFNAAVADSKGFPHVAYANVKSENAGLRYAWWDGETWHVEVLEGAASPTGIYSVSIALDKQDVPHIVYTDIVNRLVKYATRRSGKWELHVVDTLRQYSYPDRNGIALDPEGNPYITYYDSGIGVLKMAHREGGKWVAEIVDENFSGFTSSIQIVGDSIWVTYADENTHGLKCARRPFTNAPAAGKNLTSAAKTDKTR